MIEFDMDDPKFHYPENCINVKDKIILDLGCGNEGQLRNLTYPSTSEYFLNLYAKKVIGLDLNRDDINYLNEKNYEGGIFLSGTVESAEQIKSLILEYNINIIKGDCEGGEVHLLNIEDDSFKFIEEYYIETHTNDIYSKALSKFQSCNYKIREILNFTPCNGQIKVIFAYK